MKWLLTAPSMDDLIRLLKAWRFWTVGALLGALIGAAVFYLAPPPYKARATVLVDFNLEQAWPQGTDRQQFYYLERETRKLEEIAWSDLVIQEIVEADARITIQELREGELSLSQPAEGGWHFHAVDADPQRAAALASAWARAFADQVQLQTSSADGPNSFIEAAVTQAAQQPPSRSVSLGTYILVGAFVILVLASFVVLFTGKPK